jgi:hypothetical protein
MNFLIEQVNLYFFTFLLRQNFQILSYLVILYKNFSRLNHYFYRLVDIFFSAFRSFINILFIINN